MISEVSQDEGRYLVKLARNAITTYLATREEPKVPADAPSILGRKSGVFVTLSDVKRGRSLRGCIGFPLPQMQLGEATVRSAIEAATGDPRFDPVTLEEFEDRIVAEVSVLTPPAEIHVDEPRDYLKQIKVGRDGLVIRRGMLQGLLLPQVPIEYGWDEEEFLCQCCIKAGLPPDAWLVQDTRVSKFQAIVFEEETPQGNVRLKPLDVKETK